MFNFANRHITPYIHTHTHTLTLTLTHTHTNTHTHTHTPQYPFEYRQFCVLTLEVREQHRILEGRTKKKYGKRKLPTKEIQFGNEDELREQKKGGGGGRGGKGGGGGVCYTLLRQERIWQYLTKGSARVCLTRLRFPLRTKCCANFQSNNFFYIFFYTNIQSRASFISHDIWCEEIL